MGVSSQHQVDWAVAAKQFRRRVSRCMSQQDGGIAFPRRLKFFGDGIGDVVILMNLIAFSCELPCKNIR